MEDLKPAHFGIKDISKLQVNDPVFVFIGSPQYSRVASVYDKANKNIKLKVAEREIGRANWNEVFDVFIDTRHFKAMGFEYGCQDDICFFSLRSEPSLKFVPNDIDSIDAMVYRLILVTDIEEWKKDKNELSPEELIDKYPAVGSLRDLTYFYSQTNANNEVQDKIETLLSYMNSMS